MPLSSLPLLAAAAVHAPVPVRTTDSAPRAVNAAIHYGAVNTPHDAKPGTPPGVEGLRGGRITAGHGRIEQTTHATTITQHSRKLSLDWQTFDIGADDSVTFIQPNAHALAVNRIADPDGSVILGHLNANGQVWLINPNGILFGRGAQVNVGGLVASTLDVGANMDDAVRFSGTGAGNIVNRGVITTASGGYVALIGARVSNQGTIHTPGGTAALGAGSAVDLRFDGNHLLSLEVRKGTLDALAENRQLIQADGGRVLMTAGAKDSLLASVVNNSGVIQAQTVENHAGRIVLLGGMQAGTTHVGGTLDASAPGGGEGGFIETSAAHVKVDDSARITTLAAHGDNGTWLVDPQDFIIAANGGDMTGSMLGSQLGSGNVIIESSAGGASGNGDIFVNDAVDWSANTLTLTAARNIDINAVMTAGGSASLALNPVTANGADTAVYRGALNIMPGLGRVDFTGGGNNLRINGTPYTLVTSLAQLQGIRSDLAGHYALAGNIDAGATANWSPDGSGGFAGFDPLGTDEYSGTPFTGAFDGLGHTIDNLTINRPTTNNVGLFGYMVKDSIVRNVGLRGGSTRGRDNTGSLVGYSRGLISHAYATGHVVGADNVGGLVGYLSSAERIDHVYATGDVEGTGNAGGLLGSATNSGLRYAYASGNVRGRNAGGLAGYFESYSPWYTYATGDVTGTDSAGGLVGKWSHGTLWYSYASGKVTGGASTGGLIGDSDNTDAIGNYWDKDSTGQTQACGGAGAGLCSNVAGVEPIGLSMADTFHQASYGNFDFDDTWIMVDGETRPFLRFEYATSINNAHQLQLVNMDLSASYTLARDIDASVADGSRASGMWGSRGFVPLGTDGAGSVLNNGEGFAGVFDGQGFTIDGLTIDRPSANYVGLFGVTGNDGTIHNLGVENGAVQGRYYVGGLVGRNRAELLNVHAAGEVVGGVSQAMGDVGGLIGRNEGNITNAYASGTVSGGILIGGLVGVSSGTLINVYATASTGGVRWVGGLAGLSSGAIVNAYASGTVSGSSSLGGLVGENQGSIDSAYATGAVTASGNQVGGLVGLNQNSILGSYWDTDTTGQASGIGNGSDTGAVGGCMSGVCSNGGTADLSRLDTFAGWDISASGGSNAVWRIYEDHTAPLLRAFMTTASGSAGNIGKTYDGMAHGDYGVTINGVTPGFWLPGTTPDLSLILGQAHSDAVNAGSYALDGAGLYSSQMGYDLDIIPGTLTIDPKVLTIALVGDLDKIYDGGNDAALASGNYLLSGFVGGEGATVAQATGHYNSKNVADADTVTATLSGNSFNAINGTLLSNYVLPATASGTGHITPLGITVDADASSKIYDATTGAMVSLGSSDVLAGDNVHFSGTGSFADKNAGSNKTVTVNGIAASGADAGNYSYNTTATDTADIARLGIHVDITADNKVYDGTTDATAAASSSGILGGDTVKFAIDSASFADKNAGIGKTVSVDGIVLGGIDAGNYMIADGQTTTADITPATLVYVAAPGNVRIGQVPQRLSGTVTGLIGGESLAEAAAGTLSWSTPATADSAPGHYAINGGGLDARNYVFVQAPGNATALTVKSSPGPEPVPVPVSLAAQIAALQQQLLMPYRLAALGQVFPDSYTRAVRTGRSLPIVPQPDSRGRPPGGDLYVPDIRVVDGGVRLP